MNTIPDTLMSEFETAEQEASYTAWLRAKVAQSLADPRHGIAHDEVVRRMDERLSRLRQQHAKVA